jgi:hypothetical protein
MAERDRDRVGQRYRAALAAGQTPYTTGCAGPVKVHLSGGRRQPPLFIAS